MRLALWSVLCLAGSFCALWGASGAVDDTRRIEDYLASKPDLPLCATYHATPTDALRGDLLRRKVLSSLDWEVLADRSKLRPGMTECGMLAYYGIPAAILRFPEIALGARPRFDPAVVGDYDFLFIYVGADGIDPIDIFIKNGLAVRIQIELE